LDRDTAIRIFAALHRFAETAGGDLKKRKGESGETRLRVGDYRVRFTDEPSDTLRIRSVIARTPSADGNFQTFVADAMATHPPESFRPRQESMTE
jgi:mRNA-degrading endonuclease RelE of RelBE toxin-antitoxin system